MIGRVFGNYEITHKLGEGGMGLVYQARHRTLDRLVAIKFIIPQLATNPEYVRRFLREARAAAYLNHPQIISVYDAVVSEEACYLVMEYVQGRDIAHMLGNGECFDELRATRLIRKVAGALAYAHRQGIVHRDIKPQNLLLTQDDVKIGDLGVATWQGHPEDSGVTFGTTLYVSPEQAAGNATSTIDHRADIYSLGATFHHIVTGRVPVLSEIGSPEFSKAMSAELCAIISKMMAYDPAERYQSMDEVIVILDEFEKALRVSSSVRKAPGNDALALQTMAILKNRLSGKADFPSVSAAFNILGKLTSVNEETSVDDLSQAILGDFSLTNKLLKIVNSSFFGGYGGRITTVTNAIAMLGLAQVRDVALSLVLFENFQNKLMAREVKHVSIDNFLSGMIARNLAVQVGLRNREEAFICAMFHNLGMLLGMFYLPEMNNRIKELSIGTGVDLEQASLSILGISYSELGMRVATEWNLPDAIIFTMKRLMGSPLPPPETDLDQVHGVVGFSNELGHLIRHVQATPEEMQAFYEGLLEKYQYRFSVTPEAISEVLTSSLEELSSYARELGLDVEIG